MNRLRAWWLWFWCGHVQKTMAFVLGGGLIYDELTDILGAFDLAAHDLNDLLGAHTYRAIRLVCVLLIFLRALLRPRRPAA